MRALIHNPLEGECSGSPLWFTSSWWSSGVHVLVFPSDMFDVDASGPSDAVRYHKAPHQLGVAAEYLAGMQNALTAGTPVRPSVGLRSTLDLSPQETEK